MIARAPLLAVTLWRMAMSPDDYRGCDSDASQGWITNFLQERILQTKGKLKTHHIENIPE